MSTLDTNSRFGDADAAFRAIIEAYRGLSDEACNDLNARLVLILANQVGDLDALREAIALAKQTLGGSAAAKQGA